MKAYMAALLEDKESRNNYYEVHRAQVARSQETAALEQAGHTLRSRG